jgi:hypothetical protein
MDGKFLFDCSDTAINPNLLGQWKMQSSEASPSENAFVSRLTAFSALLVTVQSSLINRDLFEEWKMENVECLCLRANFILHFPFSIHLDKFQFARLN